MAGLIPAFFMNTRVLKNDLLLLLASAIWGFAFVAQRVGMEYIGPFIFNFLRFTLGSMVLIPILMINGKRKAGESKILSYEEKKIFLIGGAVAGVVLFLGSTCQQVGLVYTTAGKAGFITGLYVVIVPIMGMLWKDRPGLATWVGAILSASGLYLLSVTGKFTISPGDGLVLIGAFVWAAHVHIIGWLATRVDPIKVAYIQFAVCALLSLIVSIFAESVTVEAIWDATIPILYAGLISVGIAYTLQVVAQREAPPSHAAIILSMEAVFAGIGGWLIIHENLSGRGLVGCGLMFAGMLMSQVSRKVRSDTSIHSL